MKREGLARIEQRRGLGGLAVAVRRMPVFHDVETAQALLELAVARRRGSWEECRTLAKLALFVARHLPPGPERSALLARAWAEVGNSLRAEREDYRGAEKCFRNAERHSHRGENPRMRAEVLSLEASWLAEVNRFEEAESAVSRARALCRSHGWAERDLHLLVQQGYLLARAEQVVRAERVIAEAAARLRRKPQPALLVSNYQSLIWNTLNAAAQAETWERWRAFLDRAGEAIEAARGVFDAHATQLERIKLDWLSGRLLAWRGHSRDATLILQGAMDRFTAIQQPHHAALAGLDLCLELLRRGEVERLRATALACLRVCQVKGMPEDILAAFRLVQAGQDLAAAERTLKAALEKLGAPEARRPLRVAL